jgi:hypothetical protein
MCIQQQTSIQTNSVKKKKIIMVRISQQSFKLGMNGFDKSETVMWMFMQHSLIIQVSWHKRIVSVGYRGKKTAMIVSGHTNTDQRISNDCNLVQMQTSHFAQYQLSKSLCSN